jgi:signal transduction histidine kinase
MIETHDQLYKDLEAVRKIPIVPTLLEVICRITGMRFAAVARVTKDRWLACSVRDEIEFGLKEGGELDIGTTICNEIRGDHQAVIIEHVDLDQFYKNHHTPRIYGLQSYISFPIILKDGSFFGTLCAIDPEPAKINDSKIIGTFTAFAELLSFHLQSLELFEQSLTTNIELNDKNKLLTNVNNDLDNFVYTAAHDLKSPISNIEGLIDVLSDTVSNEPPDRRAISKIIELMRASVKRFTSTIIDLTTIAETQKNIDEEKSEVIDIFKMVADVKEDISDLIVKSNATIEVIREGDVPVYFSKKNFKSILYNLLSNAIKYRSPERSPEILVKMGMMEGKTNLSVKDNGLGIPPDKKKEVFEMFKRLHDHVEGTGIGLHIVKRIIDNSQGKIQVDSTLGKGTVFSITLN